MMSLLCFSSQDDDHDSGNVTENPSVLQEHAPPAPTTTATDSLPSESGWDDETPGPSYSTLIASSSQSQDEGPEPSGSTDPPLEASAPAARVSHGPSADEDEEECLIVGYVKPMAERTPELVQLSSDSSEDEQEAPAANTTAMVMKSEGSQPQSHMNPLSQTSSPGPASSCSPQRTRREKTPPSSQDHQAHRHMSRDASPSRLESRDDFEFRRKNRSHQHSDTKEHDETWEPSHPLESHDASWSDRSPMSIWSSSEPSPTRHDTSSDSREHPHRFRERLSHSSWDEDRGRRRKRSRSPDSVAVSCRPGGRSRESRRSRKHRRRSVSSSSADSRSERSRLDKPSGKRKYKTRHLERAAQRQNGEGSTSAEKRAGRRERKRGRERRLSRSPSVEIVFERKATDSRKKRRHRKRKRELLSPTVITIDSDSDRTIDCLDRVLDVIDQTAAGIHDEQNDMRNTHSNPALSPVRMLNLDDCVVDVVNHSSSDSSRNTESFPDPVPPVTTTPLPSDTRLLESILQDLEDFLPGVQEQEERSNQQKNTVLHDQSLMTEESKRTTDTDELELI